MSAQLYRPVFVGYADAIKKSERPSDEELKEKEFLNWKNFNFMSYFYVVNDFTPLMSSTFPDLQDDIRDIYIIGRDDNGQLIKITMRPRYTMRGLHTELIIGYNAVFGYYGSSNLYLAALRQDEVYPDDGTTSLGELFAVLDQIWMEN